MNIGVIGCGNISDIYMQNVSQIFEDLTLAACADLLPERAEAQAQKYGCRPMSVDDLLADDSIEAVLNLTIPAAHAVVAMQALRAGKHVYNEKPLALTRNDAKELLATAAGRNLRVGCAPDTFLGGGLQTCRRLIDEDAIGQPVGATAFMLCPGHERWHPDPAFYYKPGGGPMFDMGPYYVTALVSLLGPVERVTGSVKAGRSPRMVGSGPRQGTQIEVETPTHITGLMDFAGGAVGSIITSFEAWGHNLPRMEIYGTAGTLGLPDPNHFKGPVLLRKAGDEQFQEVPVVRPYTQNSRGIGLADLAVAERTERGHRASGELAYHVLDIMQAFYDASDRGEHVQLESSCRRPTPLPQTLQLGQLDH